MEKICWVETPRCSVCRPDKSFAKRRCCIGCEKLLEALARPEKAAVKKKKLTGERRRELARETVDLRSMGLSYGLISKALGLARSTVQSIIVRGKRKLSGAG